MKAIAPPKRTNELLVPINGMVKNVGKNVPKIEPIVLSASRVPITFPDAFSPIAYLTKDGVTFPKKRSGGTNKIIQENNAAQITRLFFIKRAKSAVIPAITYLPTKGIITI